MQIGTRVLSASFNNVVTMTVVEAITSKPEKVIWDDLTQEHWHHVGWSAVDYGSGVVGQVYREGI